MLKHIDLFAGIGGFSLGLEATKGFETVAFCEIEDYPRKVLNKHWPDIPIARDVTKLTYNRESQELQDDGITIYRGRIDSMSGGFPCQDISVAGKQEGIEGERSGLWSECARLLGEVRPDYAIFENVTALISGEQGRWFQRVLFDISEVGYDAEWHCILPQDVGLPSVRDRVWVIAYPAEKYVAQVVVQGSLPLEPGGVGATHLSEFGWSVDERQMGRGIDGVPDVTHRFECLGNAVVPQIPEIIGNAILRNNPC